MTRNYVDIVLVLLIVLTALRGWRRGFLLGLLEVAGWLGSLLLALRFYQPLAGWIGARMRWPEVWDAPVAFMLVALGGGLLINLLGAGVIRRLPRRVREGQENRLLGIVPGFANGLISAAVIAALLLALPLPIGLRTVARSSNVANVLAASVQRFESVLTPVFHPAIADTLNTLTVKPESSESVQLPFTVAEALPMPDLEAQMLQLVNQERVQAGFEPLAPDPELTEVARRHSADMFGRGYFAHVTPEGRGPFDRINAAGITYRTAGENLALAPTLPLAHTGLMNSPSHRDNILQPDFGRVGIGILDGGVRGLMVTQNFRD